MKTYIGTKVIGAVPMNRAEYNEYRNWVLPANEDGADEGYLVEYTDGGKGNDSRHAGYISWSPKAQFEGAYRETTGLTFGLALEALKLGNKVARTGWNGAGMWVTIAGPIAGTTISHDKFWSPNNAQFAYDQPNSEVTVRPYFTIKTVNDEISAWVPSVGDLLADDWSIV